MTRFFWWAALLPIGTALIMSVSSDANVRNFLGCVLIGVWLLVTLTILRRRQR